MTSPEGGFYSAEDADSEGEEGKFYVWNINELETILGKEDADLFQSTFNFNPNGNWNEGRRHKTNIPHLKKEFTAISSERNINLVLLHGNLENSRKKLFTIREDRIHPQKDDKILTDWNGLMIAALAKGAQVCNEPEYADAAKRAADFILTDMRRPDGRILHRYRDGHAAILANVDDYAFLIWGLLELYETVFDVHYLQTALNLKIGRASCRERV